MQNQENVLIVDDEPGIRILMADLLHSRGYECSVAESAMEALDLFRKHRFQAVVSDINMAGMNGLDLTTKVLEISPQTAVILMTGSDCVNLAIEALRVGASDYLLKPFDFTAMERSLKQATSKKLALQEAPEFIELKHHLLDAVNTSREASRKTMEAFCQTLEMSDIETFSHVQRVSAYAGLLAKKMGLTAEEQEDVRMGSLLHDIGKVVVPDRILLKADLLTEEEWVSMRKHVDAGYRIVSGIPGLERTAQIVLHHHERFGGGGYPLGLRGEEICIGARIFAVADSYDAITSDRPYRAGRLDAAARTEILEHTGTQFDPKVVEVFLAISPKEWQDAGISMMKDTLAVC